MEEASKYRKLARERLKGFWKDAFFVSFTLNFSLTLIYLLVYFTQYNLMLNLIISIFQLVITFPFIYGYLATMKKIRNMEKYSYLDIFKLTFKNFKRSWSILAHTLLKTLHILILFLTMTMLLSVSLSMLDNYNLISNQITSMTSLDGSVLIAMILFTIGLLGYLGCILIYIPYIFFAFYTGIEKQNQKPKDIVKAAVSLLKRRKLKFFSLLISFIFWVILSFVPFSIGNDLFHLPIVGYSAFLICYSLLFVYITFASIEFYDTKKEEKIESPQK